LNKKVMKTKINKIVPVGILQSSGAFWEWGNRLFVCMWLCIWRINPGGILMWCVASIVTTTVFGNVSSTS
jgi:hypothetical protein